MMCHLVALFRMDDLIALSPKLEPEHEAATVYLKRHFSRLNINNSISEMAEVNDARKNLELLMANCDGQNKCLEDLTCAFKEEENISANQCHS